MTTEQKQRLKGYLACLEECYPKEQLHSLMTTDPYSVKERTVDENILVEEITEYKKWEKIRKRSEKYFWQMNTMLMPKI